ncbi:MAG: DinB family protein [Gemmatimonadales bacterium]
MPVAHALLQSREDARRAADALSPAELWHRPGGAASVGFHLRHIGGSLDRLFTYARGRSLDAEQLAAMREEANPGTTPATAEELLAFVHTATDDALRSLREVSEEELLTARAVGRARLPSNVLGLLFHAAEHTQRHTGQVITTSKIIRGLGTRAPTNG